MYLVQQDGTYKDGKMDILEIDGHVPTYEDLGLNQVFGEASLYKEVDWNRMKPTDGVLGWNQYN